jgi:hypothetical protein
MCQLVHYEQIRKDILSYWTILLDSFSLVERENKRTDTNRLENFRFLGR